MLEVVALSAIIVSPVATLSYSVSTIKQELVRFGLIADVQYADEDDGPNFAQNRLRRYRQSLETMRLACKDWEKDSEINFAICLGDLFDHKASSHRDKALAKVKAAMGNSLTWHLAPGNHDLCAFTREEVRELLAPLGTNFVSTNNGLYYEFSAGDGVRAIVLDSYVQSVIGPAGGLKGFRESAHFLASHNPNIIEEDPARPSTSLPKGWLHNLEATQYRFVPFNGGLGETQREWLRIVLQDAVNNDEIVLVFCHVPILPQASKPHNVCWDNTDVLDLLDEQPNLRLVVFAGHDHDGGYAMRCPSNKHRPRYHLTPSAPLECDKGQVSFGSIHVSRSYDDDFVVDVRWVGKTPHNWPRKQLRFDVHCNNDKM